MDQNLIDKVAEAIYLYAYTDPKDFVSIFGHAQRLWKTDAPWDTDPNELTEHERDDYRRMARAVLEVLGPRLKPPEIS